MWFPYHTKEQRKSYTINKTSSSLKIKFGDNESISEATN